MAHYLLSERHLASEDLLRTKNKLTGFSASESLFFRVNKLKILIPETGKFSDILWTELSKEVAQNCSKVRNFSVFLGRGLIKELRFN
jgi:hypothetical protein